jgi:hypothetical protein
MNKRRDHPVTLNTQDPRVAKMAITMIRNGWTLAEVNRFWLVKLNPPTKNRSNKLIKYLR